MLRTFDEPVFLDERNRPVRGLRRKDLALLVHLTVTDQRRMTRSGLADLLWAGVPEARARHSLSQACRRVRRATGGALQAEGRTVEWLGTVSCDALLLLEAATARQLPSRGVAELYAGDFLGTFEAGPGSEAFSTWAERKRAELRAAAMRLYDRLGQDAEWRGAWPDALQLGERAVAIEPVFEEGHRRIMRSWAAQGERGLALSHYERFCTWMRKEFGASPDARTVELAGRLRNEDVPFARKRSMPPSAQRTQARRPSSRPWQPAPQFGEEPALSEPRERDAKRRIFPVYATPDRIH